MGFRDRRSHSQVTQFADCGYKYYLQRIAKVSSKPSWSLIGGRSIHKMIESFENKCEYSRVHKRADAWPSKSFASSKFFGHFMDEIEAEKDKAEVEFKDIDSWSAANKGKEDFAWWNREGRLMASHYADMNPPNRGFHTLSLEPGKLALEVELTVQWGSVEDFMIVDHMTVDRYNVVDIIDYKSGRFQPQDNGLQVLTTAHAVQKLYPHLDVRGGFYFDLRKGKISRLYETSSLSEDALIHMYETMDRAEKEELYLPRVSSFCGSCYVRRACPFGGDAVDLFRE